MTHDLQWNSGFSKGLSKSNRPNTRRISVNRASECKDSKCNRPNTRRISGTGSKWADSTCNRPNTRDWIRGIGVSKCVIQREQAQYTTDLQWNSGLECMIQRATGPIHDGSSVESGFADQRNRPNKFTT
ncbi:hypothetical protein AVEN_208485-1 [Araneus ventricosus]|uniref:Uncharacterized protein n=1 Tax=Araneus ventricosus TaxID=182803 RepID=A0A4Y2CPH4_ARAVE|nr:hypothetical protein AVEN_208485-1 [Araneus ventricosus]